jgi:hypothetical protein
MFLRDAGASFRFVSFQFHFRANLIGGGLRFFQVDAGRSRAMMLIESPVGDQGT